MNKRTFQKIFNITLLFFLANITFQSTVLAGTTNPRNIAAFYVEAYGQLNPEKDKQVARAHEVFQNILAVADRSKKYSSPVLLVVNSPGDPWAIALPDGHIILSKRALEICHRFTTRTESCLAFVLGHELAHLAHDDFLHSEVERFLAIRSTETNPNTAISHSPDMATRELVADDAGFIYAAMAGYPVDKLLSDANDFFNVWMRQTNTNIGDLRVSPNTRTDILRDRLLKLQQKLVFFQYGVRLSHFEQCDDGVHFFQEFHKTFSGREVLNNLGFCYLQIALQTMDPQRAYFYWLPGVLDVETRADYFVRRNVHSLKNLRDGLGKQSKSLLKKAEIYLREAIEADVLYLPARVNLAIVYLHLGKPNHANAVISEALEITKDNENVNMLRALALFEQSDESLDLWSHAVDGLEKLRNNKNNSALINYNLARLYDLKSRSNDAGSYWLELVKQSSKLPKPVRTIVCQKSQNILDVECEALIVSKKKLLPWDWPAQDFMKKRFQRFDINKALPNWNKLAFDWFQEKLQGNIVLNPENSASVLEMDNMLQMQVVKNHLPALNEISQLCAHPLNQRQVAQGSLLSCNEWAVLVRNNQVTEAWWIAR